MQGELRCEGLGGVVINVGGKDYAVNGVAGPRYPPIESIWNEATQPHLDRDRILRRGGDGGQKRRHSRLSLLR